MVEGDVHRPELLAELVNRADLAAADDPHVSLGRVDPVLVARHAVNERPYRLLRVMTGGHAVPADEVMLEQHRRLMPGFIGRPLAGGGSLPAMTVGRRSPRYSSWTRCTSRGDSRNAASNQRSVCRLRPRPLNARLTRSFSVRASPVSVSSCAPVSYRCSAITLQTASCRISSGRTSWACCSHSSRYGPGWRMSRRRCRPAARWPRACRSFWGISVFCVVRQPCDKLSVISAPEAWGNPRDAPGGYVSD